MGWIRHALMALGVATMLTLTGCGGTAAPQEVAATNEDNVAAAGPTEDAEQATGSTRDYPTQTNEACDVLTQDVAKAVLGNVGEESQPPPPNSNDDLSVTSCVRANSAASLDTPRSVSLLMRAAKSVTGAMGNESVFTPETLPDGAQEVIGYGEAAFWNPAFGQLNILKDGNWYILAAGPIDPAKHTLADTKTLADAIIDKL